MGVPDPLFCKLPTPRALGPLRLALVRLPQDHVEEPEVRNVLGNRAGVHLVCGPPEDPHAPRKLPVTPRPPALAPTTSSPLQLPGLPPRRSRGWEQERGALPQAALKRG